MNSSDSALAFHKPFLTSLQGDNIPIQEVAPPDSVLGIFSHTGNVYYQKLKTNMIKPGAHSFTGITVVGMEEERLKQKATDSPYKGSLSRKPKFLGANDV